MRERSVSRAAEGKIDINLSSQLVWLYFSDWLDLIACSRKKIKFATTFIFSGICGYHKILLVDAVITQAAQNAVTSVG